MANHQGLAFFKGQLIHTANWPKNFEYRDKTVAVIGNGASGVQIVPAIQPGKVSHPDQRDDIHLVLTLCADVKKLFHFIRASTWIAPPSTAVQFCQQYTDDSSNHFSRNRMRNILGNLDDYTEFTQHIDDLSRKERFKTVCWALKQTHCFQKE